MYSHIYSIVEDFVNSGRTGEPEKLQGTCGACQLRQIHLCGHTSEHEQAYDW